MDFASQQKKNIMLWSQCYNPVWELVGYMEKKTKFMTLENCLCPRYITPDDNGKVILDYCYFVIK